MPNVMDVWKKNFCCCSIFLGAYSWGVPAPYVLHLVVLANSLIPMNMVYFVEVGAERRQGSVRKWQNLQIPVSSAYMCISCDCFIVSYKSFIASVMFLCLNNKTCKFHRDLDELLHVGIVLDLLTSQLILITRDKGKGLCQWWPSRQNIWQHDCI